LKVDKVIAMKPVCSFFGPPCICSGWSVKLGTQELYMVWEPVT